MEVDIQVALLVRNIFLYSKMWVFGDICQYSISENIRTLNVIKTSFGFEFCLVKEIPVIKAKVSWHVSIYMFTHELGKVVTGETKLLDDVQLWESLLDGGSEYFRDAGQVMLGF